MRAGNSQRVEQAERVVGEIVEVVVGLRRQTKPAPEPVLRDARR